MRGQFNYLKILDEKGFFVDQTSNTLVEVNLCDGKTTRTLSLRQYFERTKGVSNIEITKDFLVLYPGWGDVIIVLDIYDWNKIDSIRLEGAREDYLWCDYSPIFVKNGNVDCVYLYRGRNRCEIYKLNLRTHSLDKVTLRNVGRLAWEGGCKKAYTNKDGSICFLSTKDNDEVTKVSLDDNTFKVYSTGCGQLTNSILRNEKYWLSDKAGNINIWTPEDGILKKIIPMDINDQYNTRNITLMETDKGVLVGGLYRDGSYLCINNDYEQSRIYIKGMDYAYDENEFWSENINCQSAWAWNRSFIQLKKGSFCFGNNIEKVYEPINLSLDETEVQMVQESNSYNLQNFIEDIL